MDQFYPQSYQVQKSEEVTRFKECADCHNASEAATNALFMSIFGVYRKGKKGKEIRAERVGLPCDCCGKPMERPNFDHCHATGKFRGWLCYNCNIGIGKLGDDIPGLMQAVDYLKRSDETTN